MIRYLTRLLPIGVLTILTACAGSRPITTSRVEAVSAVERFIRGGGTPLHTPFAAQDMTPVSAAPSGERYMVVAGPSDHQFFREVRNRPVGESEFTLGMAFGLDDAAASQPAFAVDSGLTRTGVAKPGREGGRPYWRPTLARQMGGELKEFITHDFWRGFKTVFWDVENEAVLLTTLGASITIRESGVDDAIRRRTEGQFELGDMDETIQIIGNPNTHFAGAGLVWLGSAVSKDLKDHEFAQSLAQALCVNGVSTMVLKLSANTRAPDTDNRAWPSGHTSSAFTVAAVVNEYYGPLAGVPSLALAGLVGYQRVDSRVHDLSDVVFGAMLGYVVGKSIATDQKAEFPELFGMKVIPYSDPQSGTTGLALWKSW